MITKEMTRASSRDPGCCFQNKKKIKILQLMLQGRFKLVSECICILCCG